MVSEWIANPSRCKPMQVRVLYPPPLVSLLLSFLIYDHIQIRVTHGKDPLCAAVQFC